MSFQLVDSALCVPIRYMPLRRQGFHFADSDDVIGSAKWALGLQRRPLFLALWALAIRVTLKHLAGLVMDNG